MNAFIKPKTHRCGAFDLFEKVLKELKERHLA